MATEPPLEYPLAQDANAPHDTFRVLFLDKPEQIERLKETCKQEGYVVIGAETIATAMAFLEGKNHVDVIVCAAHLETESVFAFLQHVRGHALHAKSMFLILSLESGQHGAYLDRGAARAGMALGANAYVVMPVFDEKALIAQIRQLQPDVPTLQQSATPDEKRTAE
ncbi:MAG: response regulator [Myxococcota bacterium]